MHTKGKIALNSASNRKKKAFFSTNSITVEGVI